MPSRYDSGNTAWMMASAAMVLLMTPGLAFFYGGLVRTRHVLVMLKMSFVCLSLVTVLWFAVGQSLAFGTDAGGGLIGDLHNAFFHGIGMDTLHGTIPSVIFAAFQMAFAIITVALISGSIAGRATMRGWIVFTMVWTLLVYAPTAHWVFAPDGWIRHDLGALDYAGGMPIELSSGAAGLACAVVLRNRADFKRKPDRPNNVPLIMLGLALLWFGWFGFNAGSALQAGGNAPTTFLNTQLAAAGAMIGWPLVEKWRRGTTDMVSVASSALAGMVAITPSCGEVSPTGAVIIGFAAGVVCCFAINLKYRVNIDDTLDVVGIHGWGGVVGTLAIGFFATVVLISGSIAGRARVAGRSAFVIVWTLLVYIPMAHWVFDPHGWVAAQVGAVDLAGGTVVEVSSGLSGLALAVVVGRRADFERRQIRPHNLPLVATGLALMWFGWFGFNSGASLDTPGGAAMAVLNSQLAAGAAMAGWAVTCYLRTRSVGMLDLCMGAVTGLVATTPAAGGIRPVWAVVIGCLAGLTCAVAVGWKYRLGVDDTLDVVGIHGWGGIVGMIMVGLTATGALTGKKGLFYGGSWDLLGKQLTAVVVLGLYAFVMTAIIGKAVDATVGLRQPAGAADEEKAYNLADFQGLTAAENTAAGEPTQDAKAQIARIRELLALAHRPR